MNTDQDFTRFNRFISTIITTAREAVLQSLWHSPNEHPRRQGTYLLHLHHTNQDDSPPQYITAQWHHGRWHSKHYDLHTPQVTIKQWLNIDDLKNK